MSGLPEDVYHEILSRVPAKSTLICKYVCKTWFSIISKPKFVKLHLHRTIHKNDSKLMFLINDYIKLDYTLVSSISYDLSYSSLSSSSSIDNDCGDAILELHRPFHDSAAAYYPYCIQGSCNGLICMAMYHVDAITGVVVPLLVVWNPTTRECKILPKSQFGIVSCRRSIYSFGYDHKGDNYKLVKIVKLKGSKDGSVNIRGSEDGYVTEMYTLRSDSWRSIDTPCLICFLRSLMIVNLGCLLMELVIG
ncbi:F-box protein CPR1-like [Papaver somniferum]|uniref:F-box protein CPR1-like n=1 Tax=Papaver somniferum TaxID=3469 RepID=UPI000E6F8FA0|nr:F-box protein CPR1-like [Papaver somniferum]